MTEEVWCGGGGAQALDSAVEEEWNALLDQCSQKAKQPSLPDVSLGAILRGENVFVPLLHTALLTAR